MSSSKKRAFGYEVLALPGGEVVDDQHVVAARQVQLDDVRADEARPAGDDDLHTRTLEVLDRLPGPSSRPIFGSQPRIFLRDRCRLPDLRVVLEERPEDDLALRARERAMRSANWRIILTRVADVHRALVVVRAQQAHDAFDQIGHVAEARVCEPSP
jgi:hypothetical protein